MCVCEDKLEFKNLIHKPKLLAQAQVATENLTRTERCQFQQWQQEKFLLLRSLF